MFDYIGNTEQPAWDDIKAYGVGMAKEVLESSRVLDKYMYEEYADLREHLHTKRISLSDVQKEEAASIHDTYRTYRQKLFGNVNLTTDGVPLAEAWSELCELCPHLFSTQTSEAKQALQLESVIRLLRPQHANPYGFNIDNAAYDLFLRVCGEYFNMPLLAGKKCTVR